MSDDPHRKRVYPHRTPYIIRQSLFGAYVGKLLVSDCLVSAAYVIHSTLWIKILNLTYVA